MNRACCSIPTSCAAGRVATVVPQRLHTCAHFLRVCTCACTRAGYQPSALYWHLGVSVKVAAVGCIRLTLVLEVLAHACCDWNLDCEWLVGYRINREFWISFGIEDCTSRGHPLPFSIEDSTTRVSILQLIEIVLHSFAVPQASIFWGVHKQTDSAAYGPWSHRGSPYMRI